MPDKNHKTIAIIGQSYGLEAILTQHSPLGYIIKFTTYENYNSYKKDAPVANIAILWSENKDEIKNATRADIVITNKDNIFDEEGRLCLCQPLQLKELFFHIGKSLEFSEKGKKLVNIGSFKFNYPDRLLIKDGNNIELTDKEAELINVLMKNTSKTLSRAKILENVWGYSSETDTHTLETHIYRLRKKLSGIDIILTEKEGYKINMDV